MDHQTLIAALAPEDRATLTERSDAKGLWHLVGTLLCLAVTGIWIGLGLPFWPLILVPHGILLVFLFTLEHECTHQTPFATPLINEAVGRVCGLVLFLPFLWFRYFHLAHHRYTNDPERDPELADPGRPETWPAYLVYVTGWRYWKSVFHTLGINALGRADADYLPASRLNVITLEARVMLLVYLVALIAAPVMLFWVWLLPMILGMPFLRLYLLAEHGRCPPVANMFANTRTTLTNRVVRFIAWNMPYHAEHHAYPAVPFHQLPRLHAVTKEYLQAKENGYTAFNKRYVTELEK